MTDLDKIEISIREIERAMEWCLGTLRVKPENAICFVFDKTKYDVVERADLEFLLNTLRNLNYYQYDWDKIYELWEKYQK